MKKINIEELRFNPFTVISNDWTLITAGSIDSYNTMTASWGQIGGVWGHGNARPTAVVYIRPQRYTKQFVDNNEYFSLSFFSKEYHNDLAYLGSHSGKNEDKVSKTSLTPVDDKRAVYFNQANVVLICKKIYAQEIKEECFTDKQVLNDVYPLKDFHTMYVGEIVEVLVNE